MKPSEIILSKISVPHPNFMFHRLKVTTVILVGVWFLTSRRKQIRRWYSILSCFISWRTGTLICAVLCVCSYPFSQSVRLDWQKRESTTYSKIFTIISQLCVWWVWEHFWGDSFKFLKHVKCKTCHQHSALIKKKWNILGIKITLILSGPYSLLNWPITACVTERCNY